jgi:hypothetical protein
MGDMDNVQLLWGINTLLLVILGFFIRMWISRLEKHVDEKLDTILCEERHALTTTSCDKLFRHKHAPVHPDGRGGEVILP